MNYNISGIQQIGIGVINAREAWKWYQVNLGMDLVIFDEEAEASLMLPYTDGKPMSRHAILALNHQGGAGAEIWQHTSRTPLAMDVHLVPGAPGIHILKMKSTDINKIYSRCLNNKIDLLSEVEKDAANQSYFFFKDPFGNIIQMIECADQFKKGKFANGGIFGCTIGVSDIDKSLKLYQKILGYDQVLIDEQAISPDFYNSKNRIRRVLITHTKDRNGPFVPLLGKSQIELVQNLDNSNLDHVFKDRLWGDLGYIHLCFDVNGMNDLKDKCESLGYPFTVDSGDFDMGDAAGHFAYIEDQDGTLIEFVETYKIPIMKKIGWYLKLKNRPKDKSLPRYILLAMGLLRKKG